MKPTQYPEVNSLLEELLSLIQGIFRDKLIGVYLGGSLVFGDFDQKVSDLDLVAVLSSEVSDSQLSQLRKMHSDFIKKHEEWDDRIEVCYISTKALKCVKSRRSMIVNISPGEPIHKLKSKKEWIMNWYLVREKSISLFGPAPKNIIEPISKEEFTKSVKDHVAAWGIWVKNMRKRYGQAAYTILTMCRALYAYKMGEQVSKKQAARWVQKKTPQWSNLIQQAIDWRENTNNDPVNKKTYSQMKEFVHFIQEQILGKEFFN